MRTMRTMRTALAAIAAVAIAVGTLALVSTTPVGAVHAGETITVSKTTGLADGDAVTVTVAGFTPNAQPVKLVIAGQGSLVTIPDKLNFEEYAVAPTVTIAPDGSGTAEFIMTSDHGVVQDGSTLDCLVDQCWMIAVQEPFLPQPNYASQEISFGDDPAPPPAPAPTAAPTTAAPTTAAPTTTEATTTTESTTTTTEVDVEEVAAASDDEGGSGLLFVIIAVVVVAVGAGGYFLTRRKGVDDGATPAT